MDNPIGIPCKTCDLGELRMKTLYRMGGGVVFVGYIVVVASILSTLLSAYMVSLARSGGDQVHEERIAETLRDRVRRDLLERRVPSRIVDKVIGSWSLEEGEWESLAESQQLAVKAAQQAIAVGQADRVAREKSIRAGGIAGLVLSLMGIALGSLLIMKKKVLQCTYCGVVLAAS